MGIVIRVDTKVDQSTLPAEDRISDCLEGVPVQIIEDERGHIPILPNDVYEEDTEEDTNGGD